MHNRFLSREDLSSPEIPDPVLAAQGALGAGSVYPPALTDYLLMHENTAQDIALLYRLLQLNRVILEIGCGTGKVALEIALKNPDIGVIATDQYDWTVPEAYGSGYRKTALDWKERRLETQQGSPDNLVLLRADADLIPLLPPGSIDTVLMVNPEPAVGQAFMKALKDPAVYTKIKPGEKQVVVLPFSREMGVSSCGGCEFDHSGDWSRGLGFLMESGLDFRKGETVQWQVDLVKSSLYSSCSTQRDVYFCGGPATGENGRPIARNPSSWMKHFAQKVAWSFSDPHSRNRGTPGKPTRKPCNIE